MAIELRIGLRVCTGWCPSYQVFANEGRADPRLRRGILDTLDRLGVAFSVTIHFAHRGGIKEAVEGRRRWCRLECGRDYFELPRSVRPRNRSPHYHLIVVRQRAQPRQRGPLQLDLFEPRARHYTYKALVTNRRQRAATVVAFHEGRSEQEVRPRYSGEPSGRRLRPCA